jgi:4-hydroxy-4-methyl-2-oxoglutarate aldolase
MHTTTTGNKGSSGSERTAGGLEESRKVGPLAPEALEALRHLGSSTLANAIETFHERLRNQGFVDHSVQCFCPQLEPMLGYAATLRIRGSEPPIGGWRYYHAEGTDWWDYILSLPAPRVAVVQDVTERPGLASLVGAVHMNILRALECVGVVTNGAVRDLPAAASAGFHYFAGNLTVSHAFVHIVEIGKPVEIGGLQIQSGDLLHGDCHGVQSIPLEIAARIPPVAAEIAAKERAIIDLCRSPDFSLEKLRAAIAKS